MSRKRRQTPKRAARTVKEGRKRDNEQENAARRLRRQAATLEKKAKSASGAARARLEARAKYLREQVRHTYKGDPMREQVIRESYAPRTRQARREREAQQILGIGQVGSKFFAGLSTIWDVPENFDVWPDGSMRLNRGRMRQSILDAFSATSYMDVLEQIEDAGIDIYTPEDEPQGYEATALALMGYVAG